MKNYNMKNYNMNNSYLYYNMEQNYKIGLLIPCTSKNRNTWNKMEDTYLMTHSIETFLKTYSEEHEYIFYIGYDTDDRIYANKDEQDKIKVVFEKYDNIDIQYIPLINIEKGFLTKMWNLLFKKAYEDGCDYFYQCGDDICFKTEGWVNDCIKTLIKNKNIGLTGPINNNSAILTQAFVSRRHMLIFGWFFPEEIKNWYCDDWYNIIYKPHHFFPLTKHVCLNNGGEPRYNIVNIKNSVIVTNKYKRMCNNHKIVINNYIANMKNI